MSRITRVLLPAVFVIALCGVAASAASAIEAPFYKVGGARLNGGETKEVGIKASGNYVIKIPFVGIAFTCTGLSIQLGGTLNGSMTGVSGGISVTITKTGCTVTGNGNKCNVTGGKITSNPLKGELVLGAETPVKGTKLLTLLKPATGTVISEIKFEAEAGGKCTVSSTTLEGSIDYENLNSKKEAVAQEEHEAEEEFGFLRALPNSTKECKIKEGKLDKCTTSSLKAFGGAATAEGTYEEFLTSKQKFGVFTK